MNLSELQIHYFLANSHPTAAGSGHRERQEHLTDQPAHEPAQGRPLSFHSMSSMYAHMSIYVYEVVCLASRTSRASRGSTSS
jgi:hypothetical protein